MLPDGCCRFEDELSIEGEGTAPFVIGPGWMFEVISLASGSYFFVSDGVAVRPSRDIFGVFYPRFSLVNVGVSHVSGKVTGLGGGVGPIQISLLTPVLIDQPIDPAFISGKADVEKLLATSERAFPIEINSRPSLLSLKAKRLIDENYAIFPSIARIAGRLGVTHEHLSRQFKRDFEITPSKYLHQVRIAEATYKLRSGDQIIDVAGDVGYNDLSRFYKQFRNANSTSPGTCRT